MKGHNHMRTYTGLVLTLIGTPALIAQAPAAAPTLGQRLAQERPAITKLMEAFDFPQAQARIEALLPAERPAFDTSSVRGLTDSARTYLDLCQAYFLAFQAADGNGNWEKGLDYLNKAVETAKDNVAKGKDGFTEQRDYYAGKAKIFKDMQDKNADAIKILQSKQKLEDYEENSMKIIQDWEKNRAESEKWAKYFQYNLDVANTTVTSFEKFAGLQDKKIKDQHSDIESYKGHPGDKVKWVDAVISNKAYLAAYPEKADKVALLYRLKVLDPENRKVANTLDVILGKAEPMVERQAPHKKR
jgi:hypothetical protein